MIRHRCLTSTICAFHLGFGLVLQSHYHGLGILGLKFSLVSLESETLAVARRCDFRIVQHPKRPSAAVVLAQMKHDLQRVTVRWLSVLAASVIGAYKLKDVIDLIIAAVR